MAVANDRSMNAELAEGATDGTIRKRHTGDRGGVVEATSDAAHDRAVEMGMGPSSYAMPYGEGENTIVTAGIRRR